MNGQLHLNLSGVNFPVSVSCKLSRVVELTGVNTRELHTARRKGHLPLEVKTENGTWVIYLASSINPGKTRNRYDIYFRPISLLEAA
ncbi:hypothetical protein [Planktothrix sp. FACHB-1365]|uniref:hypothetical protein n=1 Tax=Planktothrix sp. FACHB-1365 TaxID=2692855 RepID=UPI0016894F27|nr:hypothetical protein [Planktothrix sp. FACHB-1365]MBD2481507.1 hypothetical protein [Planktothrix sp. FACHB-1365]